MFFVQNCAQLDFPQNIVVPKSHVVNCNHMFLNPSKCKFIMISRKRTRMNNPPAITINGQMLETVSTFKYLFLLLSSDLSWTKHIEGICTKAKKILGLLYRQFYQHTDQETLLKLYVSHCPASLGIHSTSLRHTHKDQDLLETTQRFACKMITKAGIKATMSFCI